MKEPPKKKKTHHSPRQHITTSPIRPVKKNRYSDVVGLAIIALLGIIIYSNSFDCSFHFDDFRQIVDNMSIRNLGDVKAIWNFNPNRPVVVYTFALNYHLNQLDVWYYHLVNLVIHLVNACLVWWLTLLIFSSPTMKDQPIARNKKILAFLTALLFVSHPLATQSVTYIVQRMASMVAMFYLLSIALYMKGRLLNKGNILKTLLFTGSLISAVLAMLTKENAFTLPIAILLFEFFFLRTKKLSINFKDYRTILLLLAFPVIVLILLLKFSFSIFRPIPPSPGTACTLTPFNYLFTQFSVIIKYIQLLLLPINQKLDYNFPIADSFFEIRTLLSFLVLLTLIILAILSFKRYRIISFGIFWFFLTLSIESSFIPIYDVIYEHRTYLPSFGFFLILTSGIYLLLWNRYKYLAISIFVILIGSNSVLTYARNTIWKDDLALWNDNVLKTPDKARPFSNRGFAYEKLGQLDQAVADFSRAIGIDPNFTDAIYDRGDTYYKLGQWDKSIADFSKAIEINPKNKEAYSNRGIAYDKLGQWDKAIADYSRAIGIDPDFIEPYSNRGIAYSNLGQWDKAVADYSKAIGINPRYTEAYTYRGIAYVNLDQWDKAIADYSRAIEIDPNFTKAYYNRGITYGHLGQWNKAITDFSAVIGIDPNNAKAYSYREMAIRKLQEMKK